MNIAFLMDPLPKTDVDNSTTFALMLGANRKQHRIFYLPKEGIIKKGNKTFFRVTQVIPQFDHKTPFIIQATETLSESQLDAIWIRTDPPFDSNYLTNTWLLDMIDPRIVVLNNPSGIRAVNEKVWISQFTNFVPPTLITQDRDEMKLFFSEHSKVILKPLNGFRGHGIFYCQKDDPNFYNILELLSNNFSEAIILQRYLTEGAVGSKRIVLLNGDILGAILYVPIKGHHIIRGGTEHKTEITDQEEKMIAMLKPHLQRLGLYFVGIDVIGNFLTDFNVLSPSGLQRINRLYGTQLEDQVTAFVEDLVRARAPSSKSLFKQ